MIKQFIRAFVAPSQRSIYSFCSSTSTSQNKHQPLSIDILKQHLKRTTQRVQHQIQQLPEQVQDGTTFTYLYDGVLASIQELIIKTNQILKQIDQNEDINIQSIETAYQYINDITTQYMDPAITSKNNEFKDKVLNFDMKLGVVLNMMDKIIYTDEFIKNQGLTKERTQQLLSKRGQLIQIDSTLAQIKQQTLKIRKILNATSAAVIYGERYKNALQKDVMFLVNFPRSFYFLNKSSSISIKHYKKPDIENIVRIWNTGQTGYKALFLSFGLKLLYPLKTSEMIYVPRRQLNQNQIVTDIFKKDENRIPVRVLINQHKPIYDYKGSNDYYAPEPSDAIIIHIHGGGFVALSSLTCESYTRRWAKQTNLPVFSINYRLAPEHPFPSALEDVYHSYLFIIDHIHQHSDIRFKKVILAGDSAGGNLVCALTGLLLKNKKPIPDSLLLAYPALDLRFIYSSSRIHSFNDPLLFASMLMSVRQAYISKQSDQHPLVSPIFLTKRFVQQQDSDKWPSNWPKTRVLVGNQDPLYDDSLKLVDKLDKNDIDVKISVIDKIGHAFLNMDLVIPDCLKGIQKSIDTLKQLSQQ